MPGLELVHEYLEDFVLMGLEAVQLELEIPEVPEGNLGEIQIS